MKRIITFSLLCFAAISMVAKTQTATPNSKTYPITPVPFTSVKVFDGFWTPRLEASRDVTIPIAIHQSEITDRFKNFVMAAHPSDDNHPRGIYFDDSDVFKIIEGAAYSLQTFRNPQLEQKVDSIIDLIAAAQEPDGYLYTFRTMNPNNHQNKTVGEKRWVNVESGSHELYNQGHLYEGAVAYYLATGKRKLLDVAIKSADCICRAIGPNDDQLKIVPGHEEIELALCKLYLITGDEKYLRQAKFFIDMRGRTECKWEYNQCHKPITEQTEASGHAVRAGYLYCGIADVAALTGEEEYIKIIDRIWEDIVQHRLYLIGGIGSNRNAEAFGPHYDLPNETAYNETCAAIALTFLNQRLFLLHGDSKYIDVLERTLYNGLLSGVSVEGNTFFYPNPLATHGGYKRSEWFGCACCPSNICRFIPSLPGYVYAVKDQTIYANLFLSNQVQLEVDGKSVVLTQATKYPWNGDINFKVEKTAQKNFTLAIRIPGWVKNQPTPGELYSYIDNEQPKYSVSINGQQVTGTEAKGYFLISRQWKKGDEVQVHFDMPVRTVKANDKVEADRGMVAFERGPIVYCAEEVDNPHGVFTYVLPTHPKAVGEEDVVLFGKEKIIVPIEKWQSPIMEGGQHIFRVNAQRLGYDGEGYVTGQKGTLTLIPYHLWDHRGAGQMKVWFPQGVKEIELRK